MERNRPTARPAPDGEPEDTGPAEPAPEEPGERVRARAGGECPLCHEGLTALPHLVVCPTCQTIHHQRCLGEMGHCGTMGCRGLDRHDALGGSPGGASSRDMAMLSHVAGLLGGAIWVPLVILILTRSKDRVAARHALHALLFTLLSVPLTAVTCGLGAIPWLVLTAVAARRAWREEDPPYPLLERWCGQLVARLEREWIDAPGRPPAVRAPLEKDGGPGSEPPA